MTIFMKKLWTDGPPAFNIPGGTSRSMKGGKNTFCILFVPYLTILKISL
jgi:hypothetical protein